MRSLVLTAPGQMGVADGVPAPVCGPGDVLIGIHAVGLCGTDLGYFSGYRTPPTTPWVLGHEAVGWIVAVGDDVAASRIGERVVIEPNYPCGGCAPCRASSPALCTERVSLALTSPGLLSEFVAVPSVFAWKLPEGVTDEAAVCIEPLAVAMAAVRRADIRAEDDSALVVGAGAQGLLLVEVLRAMGRRVVVVDPHEARLRLAVALGAESASTDELFSVVFETSGSAAGGSSAIAATAPGGRIVVVGVGDQPVQLDNRILVRRGLTIIGSMIYDHPHDFATTIAAVAGGVVHPERVLGRAFSLDNGAAAFSSASDAVGKTWIKLVGLVLE